MQESDRTGERRATKAELGLAIGRRAEEIYERTIRSLYRKGQGAVPTKAYLDYRWGRSVVGTLLIARWLVSGIAADQEEIDWISRSGSAAAREGVPLVETTRGHQYWRDTFIALAREEAVHPGTGDGVRGEVLPVTHPSHCASPLRIA